MSLHRMLRLRRRRVAAIAGFCVTCMIGSVALYESGHWAGPNNDGVATLATAPSADENAGNAEDADDTGAVKEAQAVPAAVLSSTETALSGIAKLDGSAQVSTTGFVLGTDLQMQLEQELNIFASYGYSASFTLVDMTTGAALSAYGNTTRYSASAIKGPYILSLAATGAIDLDAVYQSSDDADANTRQLIDQTITVSDNNAYTDLCTTYQIKPLAQWMANAGVDAEATASQYPYLSSNDMARMWAQGYGYLFDGLADGASGRVATADAGDSTDSADSTGSAASAGAGEAVDATAASVASEQARQWLASEYSNTLNSTIHMALGDEYAVYSKAGWIGGEGGYYALNDAGIVSSSSGDYVLAVLTDACGEYGLLTDLIALLDSIHTSVMSA